MTESENIDSTQSTENVTVTSDAAFERVTSDIKMEEGEDSGFLKQNTAGLVQEVPNISILDISDFLIENKKTLYDRQNWNIVVGKAGRSIEAQPQDIVKLTYDDMYYVTTDDEDIVPFDTVTAPAGNLTTYTIENSVVKISVPGVYRVAYGWTIETTGLSDFAVGVYLNHYDWLVSDSYMSTGTIPFEEMSGGKETFVECDTGDTLELRIHCNAGVKVYGWNETYLIVQYAQQSI